MGLEKGCYDFAQEQSTKRQMVLTCYSYVCRPCSWQRRNPSVNTEQYYALLLRCFRHRAGCLRSLHLHGSNGCCSHHCVALRLAATPSVSKYNNFYLGETYFNTMNLDIRPVQIHSTVVFHLTKNYNILG